MESKNEFNKAWAGAHAEKPLRDLAREEDITPEEKEVIDGIAVRRGEKAMQDFEEGINQELSIEEKRQELANIVKEKLEKFKDEIENFYFFTYSERLNGGWGTDMNDITVSWGKDLPADKGGIENIEFNNVDPDMSGNVNSYTQRTEIGYVKSKRRNLYTLVRNIGRTLHTPERVGNSFVVTMKFKEGSLHEKEIIGSIMALFETLNSYKNFEGGSMKHVYEDLAAIAKQGIPVLEAFEDISKQNKIFQKPGRLNLTDLIKEYKALYERYKSALSE